MIYRPEWNRGCWCGKATKPLRFTGFVGKAQWIKDAESYEKKVLAKRA